MSQNTPHKSEAYQSKPSTEQNVGNSDKFYFYPEWIKGEKLKQEAIEKADAFGKYLAPNDDKDKNALTTSQLRKFFGSVKALQLDARVNKENFDILKVKLLKPQLAYAKARVKENGNRINDFYKEVAKAIDTISNVNQFENFVQWLEAVVAYHKFHGGKDSNKN